MKRLYKEQMFAPRVFHSVSVRTLTERHKTNAVNKGKQKSLHLRLSHSQGDHQGATDLATLSLRFQILLGGRKTSTPSTQRCYSPNTSFFGPLFSFLALFLVKLSWQALLILLHFQTT